MVHRDRTRTNPGLWKTRIESPFVAGTHASASKFQLTTSVSSEACSLHSHTGGESQEELACVTLAFNVQLLYVNSGEPEKIKSTICLTGIFFFPFLKQSSKKLVRKPL